MNFGCQQNLNQQYPNWGYEETEWNPALNKQFEQALALHDKDTPDRWHKVAAELVPEKTVDEVKRHYRKLLDDVGQIESGVTPIPRYLNCSVTMSVDDIVGVKQVYGVNNAKIALPMMQQERKKGIPWTYAEHMLFLKGIIMYGKGDWRNISREIVKTRTPTQVASHAQKYYKRQESKGKKKKRASIHDYTLDVATMDCHSPPLSDVIELPEPDQSYFTLMKQEEQYQPSYLDASSIYERNLHDQSPLMVYDPKSENCYGRYPQSGSYDAALQMPHQTSNSL